MNTPALLRRPLVSIVTPTFERREMLERTLRSVRAQTYANVEHIVVDGGSSDGTIQLLEAYAKTYRLRWLSGPDAGMYDAVNKGVAMAGGDIVAYLNSDDLYFPWTVETMVEAFVRRAGAGVVYGDAVRLDMASGRAWADFNRPFTSRLIAASGTVVQPAVFFRRRVFDAAGGFDARLHYVADLDFWLRAAVLTRFEHVDEFVAVDVRHSSTLSGTESARMSTEDTMMRSRHISGVARPLLAWASRIVGAAWRRSRWIDFAAGCRPGRPRRRWARFVDVAHPRVVNSGRHRLDVVERWDRLAEIEFATPLLDLAAPPPTAEDLAGEHLRRFPERPPEDKDRVAVAHEVVRADDETRS